MSIFSDLVTYCSDAGNWVKNNPGQALGLTAIAIVSGGAVGFVVGTYGLTALTVGGLIEIAGASASVSTGVVAGLTLGGGMVINGINNGLKIQRLEEEIERRRQEREDYLRENLRDQLDTQNEINATYERANQQNAQTISEKNAQILSLQTELAQRQAQTQAVPIAQAIAEVRTEPLTEPEPAPQQPSTLQTQSLFSNTQIRQRRNRQAANDTITNRQAGQGL